MPVWDLEAETEAEAVLLTPAVTKTVSVQTIEPVWPVIAEPDEVSELIVEMMRVVWEVTGAEVVVTGESVVDEDSTEVAVPEEMVVISVEAWEVVLIMMEEVGVGEG